MGPAVNGDIRDPEKVVELTRRAILGSLNLEKKFANKPEKVYKTYEEALDRLMAAAKAGNGEIPRESAEIILRRGLKRNGEGFSFTRDTRFLSLSIYGMLRNFKIELARGYKNAKFNSQGNLYSLQIYFNDNHYFLGIFWTCL